IADPMSTAQTPKNGPNKNPIMGADTSPNEIVAPPPTLIEKGISVITRCTAAKMPRSAISRTPKRSLIDLKDTYTLNMIILAPSSSAVQQTISALWALIRHCKRIFEDVRTVETKPTAHL
ncbi:MAG: hypothetical protein C4K48_02930, partial [Candidatus Thorarchaeota archaeon]